MMCEGLTKAAQGFNRTRMRSVQVQATCGISFQTSPKPGKRDAISSSHSTSCTALGVANNARKSVFVS